MIAIFIRQYLIKSKEFQIIIIDSAKSALHSASVRKIKKDNEK